MQKLIRNKSKLKLNWKLKPNVFKKLNYRGVLFFCGLISILLVSFAIQVMKVKGHETDTNLLIPIVHHVTQVGLYGGLGIMALPIIVLLIKTLVSKEDSSRDDVLSFSIYLCLMLTYGLVVIAFKLW